MSSLFLTTGLLAPLVLMNCPVWIQHHKYWYISQFFSVVKDWRSLEDQIAPRTHLLSVCSYLLESPLRKKQTHQFAYSALEGSRHQAALECTEHEYWVGLHMKPMSCFNNVIWNLIDFYKALSSLTCHQNIYIILKATFHTQILGLLTAVFAKKSAFR